jgi:hypothetical protein
VGSRSNVLFVNCDTEELAQKIVNLSEALGGISRFTLQMDNAGLTHQQLLDLIDRPWVHFIYIFV